MHLFMKADVTDFSIDKVPCCYFDDLIYVYDDKYLVYIIAVSFHPILY